MGVNGVGDGREQAVVKAGADKLQLAGTLIGDALCRCDRALTAVAVEDVAISRMFLTGDLRCHWNSKNNAAGRVLVTGR